MLRAPIEGGGAPPEAPAAQPDPSALPPASEPAGLQTQTAPQPAESVGVPAFGSGEQGTSIGPTRWEQWTNAVKEQGFNTLGGSLFDSDVEGTATRARVQQEMEAQFQAENRAKISAEEANKRYPGMPVPFDKPMYPQIAEIMSSDQKRRDSYAAWGARGNPTGWGFNLSTGVAAGLSDPAQLALQVLTGYPGLAMKALGVGESLGTVLATNLAGNAAMQLPNAIQRKAERQVVTPEQEAVDLVTGTVAATGLHYAVKGFIKSVVFTIERAGRLFEKMPEATKAETLRVAVEQHEAGLKTDMEPMVREATLREAGAMQPGTGTPEYRFNAELPHPSDVPFYAAIDAEKGPVQLHEYGPGQYAVDNGQVANNLVAAPEAGMVGHVAEIQIPPEAKFLDLEESAHSPEAAPLVAELENRFGVKLDAPEGVTIKDLMDVVKGFPGKNGETVLHDIQQVARGLGYDGYRYVNSESGAPHHGVVLFDAKEPSQVYRGNPETVPTMTPEEAKFRDQASKQPENARSYSPEMDQTVREYQAQPAKVAAPEELDKVTQAQLTEAKAKLQRLAVDNPQIAEEMKAIQREAANDKQGLQAMQDLANCLMDEIV